MNDTVNTKEPYSGSGTYFGSGTNGVSSCTPTSIKHRIRIVDHLAKHRGRLLNAMALGHLREATIQRRDKHRYSLTDEGWSYWKDVIK